MPLFSDHRILTQVAGHKISVLKVLPPLVISDEDVDEFVDALRTTVEQARHMPRSLTKLALTAVSGRAH